MNYLNYNGASYLSKDKRYYCYSYLDPTSKCQITEKLEIGKDISADLVVALFNMDHAEDLNNRYEAEKCISLYDTKQNTSSDTDDSESVDFLNLIPDEGSDPQTLLFPEDDPAKENIEKTRLIVDEECTTDQKDFFFDHYGDRKTLKEIGQEVAEKEGKPVSEQAISNRKRRFLKKMEKRLTKAFDSESS